jgi:flagellin
MRQLVVQGGNRTMSSDDRSALAQEFTKLLDTNNDIAERTAYGTTKILNGDSPQSGFQIQSGAQAGQQDTVTTGNAELSALFGKIAAGESATGNMSAISGMNNAALKALGTAGELVVAYLAVEGTTKATRGEALEEVANALFGTDREGAVADFGTDKGEGTINTAALTKILEGNIDSPYDGTTTSTAFNVIMDGATGLLANAGVDLEGSVGFTDAQINTLHGFATDTLLDAMSGLVTQVDTQRAKLGAEQNGLTSIVRSNTAAVVNVSDSRSRIMDTDFASETSELTRNQIIQQASTTILSQANQLPQTALSLLR